MAVALLAAALGLVTLVAVWLGRRGLPCWPLNSALRLLLREAIGF
jgi:hypothetical protein